MKGIDLEGLNWIASVDSMSQDELIESLNSHWKELYRHYVVYGKMK